MGKTFWREKRTWETLLALAQKLASSRTDSKSVSLAVVEHKLPLFKSRDGGVDGKLL